MLTASAGKPFLPALSDGSSRTPQCACIQPPPRHWPILSIERICAGLPAQIRSRQTLGKRQLKQGIQAMPIRKLRCSFCRKTENQVAKLVGGPRLAFCPKVYICDECVAAANLIMQGNTPPIPEVSSSLQKLKERWRHLLRRSVLREASFARTP